MTLNEIYNETLKEGTDVNVWAEVVKRAGKAYPNGVDVEVPKYMIPKLEGYCDFSSIPFYHVGDDVISTAQTYKQLYDYESEL